MYWWDEDTTVWFLASALLQPREGHPEHIGIGGGEGDLQPLLYEGLQVCEVLSVLRGEDDVTHAHTLGLGDNNNYILSNTPINGYHSEQ